MSRKREERKYQEAKAKTQQAAERDQAAKEALAEKMAQKGGAGKLTKKELDLAKRMGDGEGQKK